ncbi:MAG: efflux transporter periplasmic adaptor subunit, partial [bacterium]|nr:efflux transporter periplasmic adaptor subunit [bacterium]
ENSPGPEPRVLLRAHFAGRSHEWTGRIVRTEGEIDPKSRMVHVIARVEDPYGLAPGNGSKTALAVGLFVQAEIEGPLADNVLVIPRYAMRDGHSILVVDREDRLRIREVDVLRIDGEQALIRSTLGPGERICVSPIQIVVDGMHVLPVPDDEAPLPEARS